MHHFFINRSLLLFLAFVCFEAVAQPATQSFTQPGKFTFTVSPGVTTITVEAWGAGGGARGDGSNERGGGGGGAYAKSVLNVLPGQNYEVLVGKGGIATTNPGQTGQSSVFGNNLVVAAGGKGGTDDGGAGGSVAASIGTIRFAGGAGGDRGSKGGGGGGGSGFTTANGNNGINGSGDVGGAGGTGTGNGGKGGNKEQSGAVGHAPGGGGGGRGYKGLLSGEGATGKIMVSWVSAGADMAIVKMANTSTPVVGQAVTFTLTVNNNGPVTASGVQVDDILPSGYTFVGANPSVGTYTQTTGQWIIGSMNSGSSVTMTLTGIVNTSGIYKNTASVVAEQNDPNTVNNSSEAIVTVCKAGSSTPFFN